MAGKGFDDFYYGQSQARSSAPDGGPSAPNAIPDALASRGSFDDFYFGGRGEEAGGAKTPPAPAGRPVGGRPQPKPPAPVKAATPPPERDWSKTSMREVFSMAKKNALSDTGQYAKDIWGAVSRPKETLQALGDLAGGVGAQIGHKAFGIQYSPKDAKKLEMARALEKHYGDIYSPVLRGDFGNVKRELAMRPVSTLSDISMIAGVPGGALKGAGVVAKAGSGAARLAGATATADRAAALAKGLKVAGNVASAPAQFIDPLNLATKVASGVIGGAGTVARGTHSALSGVDADLLREASRAGNAPLGARGRGFLATNFGIENPTGTQMRFQKAFSDMKGESYGAHRQSIQGLVGEPTFSSAHGAIDAAHDVLSPGSAADPALRSRLVSDAHNALDIVRQEVLDHEARAASGVPGYGGIEGVDRLKRHIHEMAQNAKGSTKSAIMDVYNTVRDSLISANPRYSDIMEASQEAINRAQDISKTLGTGNKTAASSAISKGLKASKTGAGKAMLDDLSQRDPSLIARLAGHATSELGVRNITDALKWGANPLWTMGMGVVGSPKLAGLTHYGAGVAGAGASAAAQAGRAAEFLSPDEKPGVGFEFDNPEMQGAEEQRQQQNAADKAPAEDIELNQIMERIALTETGGLKEPYGARGPLTSSGEQAMGRYQIMPSNLASWSTEALGRPVTEDEFMSSPQIQDAIAHFKIAQLRKKYPDENDIRSIWHSGRPFKQASELNLRDSAFPERTTKAYAEERPGRASGGRIGNERHEFLVNRLIKKAKDAKTMADKTTEPLLNVSDQHIVKALDVAQRAI